MKKNLSKERNKNFKKKIYVKVQQFHQLFDKYKHRLKQMKNYNMILKNKINLKFI